MDQDQIENLMTRARSLLSYMEDREAIKIMVESGVDGSDAYLAVEAAKILNKG